jgi:hypothetical protein
LVGARKSGSSASTRVRVTSAAIGLSMPRAASDRDTALSSIAPIVPWVCAPHQSSGTGGTTAAASSFLTSRLPTCGPLPWVSTTSAPAATTSAIGSAARPIAAIWSSGRARAVGRRHGVAAQRDQHPDGHRKSTSAKVLPSARRA